VRILTASELPAFEEAAQIEGAFELAAHAVDELLRRRPRVARRLARFGALDDMKLYFCRSMLREVGALSALLQFVRTEELASFERIELERHWPGGADLALLADVLRVEGVALPTELVSALDRVHFGATAHSIGLRGRIAWGAALQLAGLWAESLRRIRLVEQPSDPRALLIRTYDTDWSVQQGPNRRLRRVDFVVDGTSIRPEETAVWSELGVPASRTDALAARGYAVLRREEVTVGLTGFTTRALPDLLRSVRLFIGLAFLEGWWQRPLRTLVSESILWREVVRRVRPKVLLVYNDVHPSGMARTVALRGSGCLTVAYEHASSWALGEEGWIPDFVFGFTVVDVMVTWGPLHSDTYRNHRGAIDEFWEVGCLWSEHARLVREDEGTRDYYLRTAQEAHGVSPSDFEHAVGVFDTSVVPLLLGWDDMVAFYAGIASLAYRMPRVLFLCKPKGDVANVFGRGAGGGDVAIVLEDAPNVVMLNEFFETAAVVGLCDLSVNACYTSPAIETIGAGRPALYYDPTARFPEAFLRKIPRFVATSEDELAVLVEEQLAAAGDARAADLRERFAELEGHFDGLAITRLRAHLRAALDA
jgi:polysaccharide biosynthesis PFTS motif protein